MTPDQLEELRSRAAALATEIDTLSTLETPTDEQTARLAEAIVEAEPLAGEVRAAETAIAEHEAYEARMTEIRGFAARPGFAVNGDGARVAPVPGVSDRNIWDVAEARNAARSEAEFRSEINSRAATAIEQSDARDDSWREQATLLLERGLGGPMHGDPHGTAVAEHWLRFANPEYRANWQRAMRGDPVGIHYCQEATRAAWAEGGTTTGGFAVVADYDLTLLLINDGNVNPFRDIARTVKINSNVWKGLTTAGVTAEWVTESTEAADATPAVAQPSITAYREDAYLQASFEVVADSDLGSEVSMLVADAFSNLEATAFATGTGGGQPFGVVTRVAAVTGARVAGSSGAAGAADLVAADIYAVDNALGARYRRNASWAGAKPILNKIRQLATGSGPQHAFWADFGSGMPAQLIGYNVYEASAMDSTIVSGSNDDVLLLGDFRNGYVIVDRIGITTAFNPLVIGTNRRPTGEVGWFAYKRTGADVVDSTNTAHFKLLRL